LEEANASLSLSWRVLRESMVRKVLEKILSSTLLGWLILAPALVLLSLYVVGSGPTKGFGISAVIVSPFIGISLGQKLTRLLARKLISLSENLENRLAVGFSVFCFLLLPVLVAQYTNTYLGTEVEMLSVGAHLIWTSIIALGAFLFYVEK
jgi:hypothetical protein